MRFVLCARDPMTGASTIVGDMSYATRAEATDALAAPGSLAGLRGRELFLLDLDAATPVVVVSASGREPVLAGPNDVPGVETDEPVLPFGEWPFVSTGAAGGVGPSTLTGDRVEAETDLASVWWLEAGVVEEPASASPSEHSVEVADRENVEPVADAGSPEAEPAPDEAPLAEDASELQPEERAETEASAEQAPEEGTEGRPAELQEPALSDDAVMTVDFEAWTCSACVYVTTCPQSGTGRPATCGSFQWRPE
jgi:rubrerythrin